MIVRDAGNNAMAVDAKGLTLTTAHCQPKS